MTRTQWLRRCSHPPLPNMTSIVHLGTIIIVLFTLSCCGHPAAGASPRRTWYVIRHRGLSPSVGRTFRSSFTPKTSSSVITRIQITNASEEAFRNLINLAARKPNPQPRATTQISLASQAAFLGLPKFQKHKSGREKLHNPATLEARESTSKRESQLTASEASGHRWPQSLHQHSSLSRLVPHVRGRDPAAARPLTIANDINQSSDVSKVDTKLNSDAGPPATRTNAQTPSQDLAAIPHQSFSPNFAPNQQWTLEHLDQHLRKPVSPDASKFFQSLFGGNEFKLAGQGWPPLSNSQFAGAQVAFNDVLDLNLTDPANFQLPDSRKQVYQPPVGGKCFLPYSFVGGDGVCIAAKDCPSTLAMMAQFEYTHIRSYLLDSICRWEESGVYYCCPLYSTSTVLPGGLTGVVPLPPVSPAPAPLPPDCGKVLQRNPRIIGGVVVEEGEFPWLASIGSVSPRDASRFVSICSGTLVTRRHVLTAAHCFRSFAASTPTVVRLAEGDLFDNDNSSVHADYVIISLHAPLFYYYSTINDVMLLTLDRDVVFNDYIQPACLPLTAPFLPAPGDTVTAVGYGNVRETGTTQVPARYPYRLSLPVISNSECQNVYYGLPPVYIVDDRVFCEGGIANESTCKGDSGGPLHYWDETEERYLVVGVVNAGIGCGVAGNPSIDLRVGAFLPWIETVIAG